MKAKVGLSISLNKKNKSVRVSLKSFWRGRSTYRGGTEGTWSFFSMFFYVYACHCILQLLFVIYVHFVHIRSCAASECIRGLLLPGRGRGSTRVMTRSAMCDFCSIHLVIYQQKWNCRSEQPSSPLAWQAVRRSGQVVYGLSITVQNPPPGPCPPAGLGRTPRWASSLRPLASLCLQLHPPPPPVPRVTESSFSDSFNLQYPRKRVSLC